jgi:hypothetical protein
MRGGSSNAGNTNDWANEETCVSPGLTLTPCGTFNMASNGQGDGSGQRDGGGSSSGSPGASGGGASDLANLGRFIRKLFGGAQSGAVSEPVSLNATVGDLRNLQYGGEFDSDKAASLAALEDDDLLATAQQTNLKDAMYQYPGENTLGNGNHRMAELLQRAIDPGSAINYDSPIYISGFGG